LVSVFEKKEVRYHSVRTTQASADAALRFWIQNSHGLQSWRVLQKKYDNNMVLGYMGCVVGDIAD
jgi:hypothetical protein